LPARQPVAPAVTHGVAAPAHLHVAAGGIVEFAIGVVEHPSGRCIANRQDPVAATAGRLAGAMVQKARTHRKYRIDLPLQQAAGAVGAEARRDAVVGAGSDLGRRGGGVAEAQHRAQIGVVGIRAQQRPGPQILHR
ncbi:MAG: hypothetical protein ACK55Z_22040, partial [bacterium]